MKYNRLPKPELEELHLEFTNFLASQQIDKSEWDDIKLNKPEIAEQELDIFSDLVWEGALNSIKFLEKYEPNLITVYSFLPFEIEAYVIKSKNKTINLLSENGTNWLNKNLFNENEVEILFGTKKYTAERNLEIYKLIATGAKISNGFIFDQLKAELNKNN